MKKIGLIARMDNSGLGRECYDFYRYLKFHRILGVAAWPSYKIHGKRFGYPPCCHSQPSDEALELFCDGLDAVFTIETPYNWNLFKICRNFGVTSIMKINYEGLERTDRPDIYVAPNQWHSSDVPTDKIIPFPVDRGIWKFKQKKYARVFLHSAGNTAPYDREGTELFLQAIPLIRSNIRIIIQSQRPVRRIQDPRVKYQGELPDHKLYNADVLVHPRRYGGQTLKLTEAISCGLVPIMTDMIPQNQWLPKEFLIPISGLNDIHISQKVEICDFKPEHLASKIDELAGADISKYSGDMGNIAEQYTWEKVGPMWEKLFSEDLPKTKLASSSDSSADNYPQAVTLYSDYDYTRESLKWFFKKNFPKIVALLQIIGRKFKKQPSH